MEIRQPKNIACRGIAPLLLHWVLFWVFLSTCTATLLRQISQIYDAGGSGQQKIYAHGLNATVAERYPYVASLKDDEMQHKCSGILVHSQFVLTAKHCIETIGRINLAVVFGEHGLNNDETEGNMVVLQIEKYIKHHALGTALLKLSEPIGAIPVPTLAESDYTITPGLVAALGWKDDFNGTLHLVDGLDVVENKRCNNHSFEIQEDEFCLATTRTTGNLSEGFSGGPILYPHHHSYIYNAGEPENDLIIGLVPHAQSDLGAYVRMSSLNKWIKKQTLEDMEEHASSGSPEHTNRWPNIASIRRPGTREHVCSGQLLYEQYVITPAHCVDPTSIYSAGLKPIVHIGGKHVDDLGNNVKVALVKETIIHEEYLANPVQRSPYNIALLKLSEKVNKSLPLIDDKLELQTGRLLSTLGWGKDKIEVGDAIFGYLNREDAEYFEGEWCNRSTLWNGEIHPFLMCALNQQRKASCVVDSGAPLVLMDAPDDIIEQGDPCFDKIVGLNINGAPCGTPKKPDIYIDIRGLAGWIQDNVK